MNKERIEFLENQIRENAGTATAVFLNKWLEELKADEWVSVNDRLPEKSDLYLVTTSWGSVECQCHSVSDGFEDLGNGFAIAWKELPKPYVKGDE